MRSPGREPESTAAQTPVGAANGHALGVVTMLLELHGFTPSVSEVAALAAQVPSIRAGVARLHEVPGTRYADLPVVFDPGRGSA